MLDRSLLRSACLAAFVGILLTVSAARSATYSWQPASGNWSAASNWGGTLPTGNDFAYISNGGTATVTQTGTTCGTLSLGSSSAGGSVQMTGGSFPATSYEFVGDSGAGAFVQTAGTQSGVFLICLGNAVNGNGTYSLSGSGRISTLNLDVGGNGIGNFAQTGGTNNVETFLVGANPGSSGTYNLSGSGILSVNSGEVVGSNGLGVFTQAGGTNSVLKSPLFLGGGSASSGTYNLNGGMLLVSGVGGGAGTSTLNLNGGTLKASDNSTAWVNGLTAANLQSGGAVFDTNGFGNTVVQSLLHDPALGPAADGGLTKLGAGALTLAASNTYTGATTVSSGTLVLADPLALQNSTLNIGANGHLSFGTLTSASIGGLGGTTGFVMASSSSTALAISIGSNGANTTFSGSVSGSGSLTKVGTGTLTVQGGVSVAGMGTTISGGTVQGGLGGNVTINGGTFDLKGFSDSLGTASLVNGAIVSSATASIATLTATSLNVQSGTISISSGGINAPLIKTSSGTVTLLASNGNSTGTSIYDGALQIGSSSALGSGGLNLYGGTLCSSSTTSYALPNSFTLSGSAALGDPTKNGSLSFPSAGVIGNTNSLLTINCPVTFNGGGFFAGASIAGNAQLVINSPVTIDNGLDLSVTGSITKSGSSILILNGIPSTPGAGGPTTVSGGTLQLNTSSGTPTGPAPQLNTPSIAVNGGGVLALNANDVLGYRNGVDVLTINGGTVSNITASGRVTIQNTITMTGGVLTGSGSGDGSGVYSFNTTNGFVATSDANGIPAVVSSKTISLEAGNLTFNVTRGVANPPADMVINSAIVGYYGPNPLFGIVKTGNGVMTLTGSNTYTGSAIINQGELMVNGPVASAVTVNSGGILTGTGSLTSVTVNSGGQLAPGDAPGTLTLSGSLTLLPGAVMDYELDTPLDSDEVLMPTSRLVLGGQQFSDFNFTPLAGFGPGTYTLIDAGSITGGLGANTTGTIGGFSASLAVQGNDLMLNVVPEPSTLALLVAGAVGVVGFVRGKWRSCGPKAQAILQRRAEPWHE
jgi:autotransporter-associated beta strand protein